MENETEQLEDGTLQMPLPFCCRPSLPNNRSMAYRRFQSLKQSLEKDPLLEKEYKVFMSNLIKDGHAEPVPQDSNKIGKNMVYTTFCNQTQEKKGADGSSP